MDLRSAQCPCPHHQRLCGRGLGGGAVARKSLWCQFLEGIKGFELFPRRFLVRRPSTDITSTADVSGRVYMQTMYWAAQGLQPTLDTPPLSLRASLFSLGVSPVAGPLSPSLRSTAPVPYRNTFLHHDRYQNTPHRCSRHEIVLFRLVRPCSNRLHRRLLGR